MQVIFDRLEKLERQMARIVRVGIVDTINPEKGTVRVKLPDADNIQSGDLPVMFPTSGGDKFYFMPDVGEQVICVFLPYGQENGFVIGAYYSDADAVPVSDAEKRHIRFKDGSSVELNRSNGKLTVDVTGDVQLNAAGKADVTTGGVANVTAGGKATVKAATIELDGGSGGAKGVVTGECMCAFTGAPHMDISTNVKASK